MSRNPDILRRHDNRLVQAGVYLFMIPKSLILCTTRLQPVVSPREPGG